LAREQFDLSREQGPHRTYFFFMADKSTARGNVTSTLSIGEYDRPKVRFPGSFGSALPYYVVPKVILFRTEHSRRTPRSKGRLRQRAGHQRRKNVFRTGGRSRW
jgi:glutaconate CoA-transferase subunit B